MRDVRNFGKLGDGDGCSGVFEGYESDHSTIQWSSSNTEYIFPLLIDLGVILFAEKSPDSFPESVLLLNQ